MRVLLNYRGYQPHLTCMSTSQFIDSKSILANRNSVFSFTVKYIWLTYAKPTHLIVWPKSPKFCCAVGLVGRICADLGPDCSLFVKSTKISGMIELIMTINMWYCAIANFFLLNWFLEWNLNWPPFWLEVNII